MPPGDPSDASSALTSSLLRRLKARDSEGWELAQHLEECAACQRALPGSAPADALVALLREPLLLEPHAEEPECASTLETLVRRLAAGPSATDSCQVGVATAAPAARQELLDTPGPPTPSGTQPAVADAHFVSLPCSFGRYQILEPLGKGGMGAVYLARDGTLDRKVLSRPWAVLCNPCGVEVWGP